MVVTIDIQSIFVLSSVLGINPLLFTLDGYKQLGVIFLN